MRWTAIMLTLVCLVFADGNLVGQDYLTKDGKLTNRLKVVQLQGGFAGFTGVQYTVAPNGSWTSETIFNEKITPKDKGKLTEQDVAKLGALLKKYELTKLPEKSGAEPGANPHIITVEFGKHKARLVGQVPPKLDLKNPAPTVESRFAGLWEGVVRLLAPASKDE